jgi:hypothetical protein
VTLPWTLSLFLLGLALCGFARWQESRPRALGEVRLVPTTFVLGLGVLLTVLAGAHLVSLVTGVPLKGRYGP